ncbi:MAG: YfhO family protein [Solobacterium sp.]|nr:YfhO family protein [Solobacterium sp.]
MDKKRMPGWAALTILVTLISLVIFLPYFITGKAFILGWDMRTIYSSNFENLRTMVQAFRQHGTLPYWSWVNFLGNDFYSSKLFYFNDFFEYFFAFTSLPYSTAIVFMTYLRYLTAALSFYAYCRYQKYSERTSVLGALLFAFSAYLIQIMRDPFFASYVTFLPLYFLSVDRYIREDRFFFFIFMVFFMYFNSYYLFYMTSLFTILYFIWRWKKQYGNLRGMMKEAVKLIGYYLVGFLTAGIIVVPEFLNVLANSRVGERSALLYYQSPVPYFSFLTGLFTPTSITAYRTDAISSLYLYDTPNHQLMAAYLHAGSVTALLLPQLFQKKESHRKFHILVFALITAFSLIPILNSVMHGFSEPSFRWLINAVFLIIAMILPVIEHYDRIDRKLLQITAVVLALALIISPLLFARLMNAGDIREGYYYLLACVPFFFLSAYALRKEYRGLLTAVTVIEMMVITGFSCYGNETQREYSKADTDRMSVILGEKNYYNGWTLTLDEQNKDSFYRSYIDRDSVYFSRGTNYNLDENIMGTMAYDSTYLASTNDLVKLDPERVVDYLPWTFDIENPDILNLVSVKYAVIGENDPCPFINGMRVGTFASWPVYLNLDYINLGKTYTEGVITYDQYRPSMSDLITRTVICHPEDKEEIYSLLSDEEVMCYSASAGGNHVSAGLKTTKPGFAVLSVPYDEGWRVLRNGQEVRTYCVNGGMTGIAVTEGENDIQMWFTPKGLNPGKLFSLAGLVCLAGILIWRAFKKNR